MKKVQILLLALTVLSIGCSTVSSEKQTRETASVFGGDGINVSKVIKETFTIENSKDLFIYCDEARRSYHRTDQFSLDPIDHDEKFYLTLPNSNSFSNTFMVAFENLKDCYQAQNYLNMLKRGEIFNKIIITIQTHPTIKILKFGVYQ